MWTISTREKFQLSVGLDAPFSSCRFASDTTSLSSEPNSPNFTYICNDSIDGSSATYLKLWCLYFLQLITYLLPSKETTSTDNQDKLIIARNSDGYKFHWHQQNDFFHWLIRTLDQMPNDYKELFPRIVVIV